MYEDNEATELVTVELNWNDLDQPYRRTVTRRQLAQLLLELDDMAETATADQ
ncbi:hypothetical protein ACFYM0_14715 [Streptomyces sp. NPDC006487]|uniref:hypothetical protein n=1 Tax=Streptomyces sp. NPDC006487 TaxID=3364748 RepID=UPI0036C61493